MEKLAAQAATEIGISGLQRRIAGRAVGSEQVRAEADLDGQVATVRLQLAAAFPVPLPKLTRRVRQHVTAQVQTLCSIRVDHVDITVAARRRRPAEGAVNPAARPRMPRGSRPVTAFAAALLAACACAFAAVQAISLAAHPAPSGTACTPSRISAGPPGGTPPWSWPLAPPPR